MITTWSVAWLVKESVLATKMLTPSNTCILVQPESQNHATIFAISFKMTTSQIHQFLNEDNRFNFEIFAVNVPVGPAWDIALVYMVNSWTVIVPKVVVLVDLQATIEQRGVSWWLKIYVPPVRSVLFLTEKQKYIFPLFSKSYDLHGNSFRYAVRTYYTVSKKNLWSHSGK